MELKDYQSKVLEQLERYLRTIEHEYHEQQEFYEFQCSKGKKDALPPAYGNYLEAAWDKLYHEGRLPNMRYKDRLVKPPYLARYDGMHIDVAPHGRAIPNICLKVPTGGGKTLLACASIERINHDYFKRSSGFILWVVPSETIYRQTLKSLCNRMHMNRQILDRASGGRVKILEKGDNFTQRDVKEYLCVMVLMLQASARKSKETLKMFQDSGRFLSFFPDEDDFNGNNALLNLVPNLTTAGLDDATPNVMQGLTVLHSLGNVLKLVQPIVIIDEGHKAYSENARDTINAFNPRFVLELSATPNQKHHLSNVLVEVSGTALKDEQMIKLPINVHNTAKSDWKHTLNASFQKLQDLQKEANRLMDEDGQYIRPIALLRVERTGKDQRGGSFIHSEDVREYLQDHLGLQPEEIRVKSSEMNEIEDEDLLSYKSKVRFIITKDALKEGWDCPFAYVLAILSNTKGETALTQMIGRVLRQPEARTTAIEALNQCYVFCRDQEVEKATECIKKGLTEEGLADIAIDIKVADNHQDIFQQQTYQIKRKECFKEQKIFLPQVLHRDEAGGLRPLDYHQDILGQIDWADIHFDEAKALILPDIDTLRSDIATLDYKTDLAGQREFDLTAVRREEKINITEIDFSLMTRQTMDKLPNAWEAGRIVTEAIEALRGAGNSDQKIAANSVYIVDQIRKDIQAQVLRESENLFRNKVKGGEIIFKLVASPYLNLNWQIPQQLAEVTLPKNERVFSRKQNGEMLERSLFDPLFDKDMNNLEKKVAWYCDDVQAVKWWHRLAVKNGQYAIQGWQKDKIYPDFLVCMNRDDQGMEHFHFVETKGDHLKGNDDTIYKANMFRLLSDHFNMPLSNVGEFSLIGEGKKMVSFQMLLEDNWERIYWSMLLECSGLSLKLSHAHYAYY